MSKTTINEPDKFELASAVNKNSKSIRLHIQLDFPAIEDFLLSNEDIFIIIQMCQNVLKVLVS
jgi:hypothetical protein